MRFPRPPACAFFFFFTFMLTWDTTLLFTPSVVNYDPSFANTFA